MPSRPRWRGACHERASDPGRNEPATDAQRAASGRAACVPAQVRGSTPGRSGGRMSRYRVSMDIGGTFTDVVAYDEERGTYRAGKSSTTPERPRGGRLRGARDRRRLARRDRVHGARHDAGPQRLPPAPRRARAAAGDARRRRRLPHRPRQPTPPVRRPLPQADAARAAPRHRRDRRAARLRRRASSSRWTRTAVPRGGARARDEGFGVDRRRLPLLLRQPGARAARPRTILREELGDGPSRSRIASRASGASTSARRRRCSTRTRPRRAPLPRAARGRAATTAASPSRCT